MYVRFRFFFCLTVGRNASLSPYEIVFILSKIQSLIETFFDCTMKSSRLIWTENWKKYSLDDVFVFEHVRCCLTYLIGIHHGDRPRTISPFSQSRSRHRLKDAHGISVFLSITHTLISPSSSCIDSIVRVP